MKSNLVPGNTTIVLQFDPARFVRLDEISRVHLVDLVLSREGVELERKDAAWTSGDMDSRTFEAGGASSIASSIVQSSEQLERRQPSRGRPQERERHDGDILSDILMPLNGAWTIYRYPEPLSTYSQLLSAGKGG